MKSLQDATRVAGVHRIECPQCGKRFSSVALFKRVFGGIAELVKSGERVNIPTFGIFRGLGYAAKKHKSPIIPGKNTNTDKLVLKFQQSQPLRRFLNPPDADAVANGKKAAAHKKLQQAKQAEALDKMNARKKAAKKKTSKKRTTSKKKATKR